MFRGIKTKRLLSLVLTVLMVFAVFPAGVFAADLPTDGPKLQSLLIHTGFSPMDDNVLLKNPGDTYPADLVFDPGVFSYTLPKQNDSTTQLRFRALAEDSGAVVTIYYGDGESKDITWTSGNSLWANCLQAGKNEFTIVVTDGDKDSTTYTFKVDCEPTLTSLAAKSGSTQYYFDSNFASQTKEYTIIIPNNLTTIELSATPKNSSYELLYNGQASSTVDVSSANKIEVVVSVGEGANKLSNTYTINLDRTPLIHFKPIITPSDAVFNVYDQKGNVVVANSDGSYDGLFSSNTYTYTLAKYGYVAQSGEVPAAGGEVNFDLVKASDDGIEDVGAYWKNFRNSDENMAITDVALPIVPEDTKLIWNKKLGTGWGAAPSVQIIVDNALVVMTGTSIYKLDLATGEVLATGQMVAATNWGYTPPTYAEGMIFAPLQNGTIQAFNAKTLESVWVYQDNLKGQSLSPIAYSDGYIYTGFWNSETGNANFVCLSVTDEDPSQTNEAKIASWKHTQPGGFYWAGAVVIGDAVIVGTDDGQSGESGAAKVYSFNKYTGEIISGLDVVGDQRSSIAYDKASGKIYFTTKCGYLYSASVNAGTGVLSNLKGVRQEDGENKDLMSTSTPVVYGGKVYIGVGQYFQKGWLLVADAESLEKLFTVSLQGYPQCSMLLTTAYEDTGYLYLYSTYNYLPGGISMIKVKTDATTAADAELIELYDAEGFSQYCITSIICGPDGTLYYKNDSANILAVGMPKVAKVINLINAIGTVTLDSGSAINKARNAYDSLTEAQKKEVTNYSVLTTAEMQYELLVAKFNAKTELENYKNADDYREAQKIELANAITAGKEAIDAAADIAGVNKALADAKAVIDKIKTDAQLVNEKRLAGDDRYETAVKVSQAGWTTAGTVILARGDDFADAVAGVPLAHQLNAPILLTQTNSIVSATIAEITRLKAERVIILGGPGAISDDVMGELEGRGLVVERIQGADRYETAVRIAERLASEGAEFDTAFIAVGTNFADALAASSYAAMRGQPILLTDTNYLPQATKDAMINLGIKNTVVCGGPGAVSESVFDQLPNPKRVYGNDRYLTALELAKEFMPKSTKHVYVATGLDFPDAVAGGVLAAKNNSGVLLVQGNQTVPIQQIQDYYVEHGFTGATMFGGSSVVSSELEQWFKDNSR